LLRLLVLVNILVRFVHWREAEPGLAKK